MTLRDREHRANRESSANGSRVRSAELEMSRVEKGPLKDYGVKYTPPMPANLGSGSKVSANSNKMGTVK